MLNLLVLYSSDIERLHVFYQKLFDKEFVQEQHGSGPVHYSYQIGTILFELYPTAKTPTHTRLGFSVNNLDDALKKIEPQYIHKQPKQTEYGRTAIIQDPDGRKIELSEKKII